MAKYNVMYTEESYRAANKESKEALEDYIIELKSKGRSEGTIKQYKADIMAFISWVYDNADNQSILDIKRRTFRSFFLFMKESGKSSARINRFMSSIRCWCQYLEDDEDIFEEYDSNPMRKIKSIEGEKVREIFFLTDEQISYLIDYLMEKKQYQKALYVSLSYDSGGRRLEIYGVKKQCFLEDGNTTNLVRGKRNKTFFLVYSDKTRDIARKYLEQRGEDEFDDLWITGTGENKRPLGYDSLYNFAVSFRKILQEKYNENIELNPHSFRHSMATNLHDSTHSMLKQLGRESLTLNEIKVLLHHESIDMSQSYLKNRDDELIRGLFDN